MIEIRWQDAITDEPAPVAITMRNITESVATKHGLKLEDLRGPERRRYVSHPRQEAFAIIYSVGRFSLPQIGRFFGGRDHTTVLDGIRRYHERLAAEQEGEAA